MFSTSVNSHRGWAGSKLVIAAVRASSTTVAAVRGAGAAIRRTCHDRSKSGEVTQRGVASRAGGSTTTMRNDGTIRVARSRRSTMRSQSGAPASQATVTIVDLSCGSASMRHVKASLSRMNSSRRSSTAPADRTGGASDTTGCEVAERGPGATVHPPRRDSRRGTGVRRASAVRASRAAVRPAAMNDPFAVVEVLAVEAGAPHLGVGDRLDQLDAALPSQPRQVLARSSTCWHVRT